MSDPVNGLPHIAVIVSNYNCRECLDICLASLLSQDYPDFSVHFMDNASSDGSVEHVARHFPAVKLIANTCNYGFAEGYNRAIKAVDAPCIALVNSDTKALPGWLSALYRGLKESGAAIAGSKICFMEDPGRINSAGKQLTYSGIGTDIGYGMADGPRFGARRETAALCGASMLVDRAVFLALGGFDEDYFILCEDTDLCWRAWLRGWKVVYEPSSVILHRFGEAIGKRESPLRVFYSQRNAILIVVKDFGALRLCASCLVIAGYSLLKAAVFLLTFRFKSLKALLTGTFSALRLLPSTLKKRGLVQSSRAITDRELAKKGFIASFLDSVREYIRVSRVGKG
jgi:GT2 family glycosyltransferase